MSWCRVFTVILLIQKFEVFHEHTLLFDVFAGFMH
jgi:hypothetical protein